LTCGRSARPGRAAAIVATLRSIVAESATSAGVDNSEINIPGSLNSFCLPHLTRDFIWRRRFGGAS
jgi:hypothetical protein